MTREVVTIDPDLNLKVALDTMMDRGIHIIVVSKGEAGVSGILTRHHVRRKLEKNALEMDRMGNVPVLNVREEMVYFVFKVKPETPLREVIRLMDKQKVRALPVVDQGQAVGIVTRGDILRYALRQDEAQDQP
jgi:CBS domain-containing protein